MAYGHGLDYLQKQRAEYQASRGEGHMKWFWPSPREIAQFWWITAPDDFLIPLIHMVYKKRPDGSEYPTDALCGRETRDDPKEKCEHCMAGIKGPFDRAAAYIFVEKIFHLFPPKGNEGADWKSVKRAGTDKMIWVEDVNQVRFFMMKDAMSDQVMAAYLGDPEDLERKPTLFDRPYRVEVTGEKATRRDTLKPQDKKEMPAAVLEAASGLPSLEETAQDKMGPRKTQTVVDPDTDEYFAGDPGPQDGDLPLDPDELVNFN